MKLNLQSKDYVNGITTGIAIAVACGLIFKNWTIGVGFGVLAAIIEVLIRGIINRSK